MTTFGSLCLVMSTIAMTVVPASAQEMVDYEMIDRIRDGGLNRSEVMDHMF